MSEMIIELGMAKKELRATYKKEVKAALNNVIWNKLLSKSERLEEEQDLLEQIEMYVDEVGGHYE